MSPAMAGGFFTSSTTWEALLSNTNCIKSLYLSTPPWLPPSLRDPAPSDLTFHAPSFLSPFCRLAFLLCHINKTGRLMLQSLSFSMEFASSMYLHVSSPHFLWGFAQILSSPLPYLILNPPSGILLTPSCSILSIALNTRLEAEYIHSKLFFKDKHVNQVSKSNLEMLLSRCHHYSQ